MLHRRTGCGLRARQKELGTRSGSVVQGCSPGTPFCGVQLSPEPSGQVCSLHQEPPVHRLTVPEQMGEPAIQHSLKPVFPERPT